LAEPNLPDARAIATLIASALPFKGLAEATLASLGAVARPRIFAADERVYEAGEHSHDLFIVAQGFVRLEWPAARASAGAELVYAGEAFGWNALGESTARRQGAVAVDDAVILVLPGAAVIDAIAADPGPGRVSRDDIAAAVQAIQPSAAAETPAAAAPSALELRLYRLGQWLRSPRPWLMLLGYGLLIGFWYLSVEVLRLPRFAEMPGPTAVFKEWLSASPTYGVSIHTPVYYQHILISLQRVLIAFTFATLLGVPTGLLLGWSKGFRDYVFPLFEMLRPIPILAWVPLAIVMLPGNELPVLYLTFLASFFATALNTMLGVRSIEPSLSLAAQSLGASRWQVFRHVVIPGSLPFIFTGLQISIGVAWFSLVAAEMVSGQFGLGYLINTSYTSVSYPTIVIAMLTLGAVGYVSSAAVRFAGSWLMDWRGRQLALGESR
jgi:NitT/TauT family transport system permease protein